MKINYANNPVLGPGKWDPILSLLTPDGDAIVLPAALYKAVECHCTRLASKNIAAFSTSFVDGVFTVRRLSDAESKKRFERFKRPRNYWLSRLLDMQADGTKYYFDAEEKSTLKNAASRIKKMGLGKYVTCCIPGEKSYVVRIK